jgi:translocation and assembly module TamA
MGREINRFKRIIPFMMLVFWAALISDSRAAEPIQVVVEGVEGEALKNVQAALSLPPGMVREGKVDRVLLDIFRRQAPEKTRKALEPFGYFDAEVTAALEESKEGKEILRIQVHPGKPVRLTSVRVEVLGPGKDERKLSDLVKSFPLKAGEPLNQGKYEKAKDGLRESALELGYVKAHFSTHTIRINREELSAAIDLVLETGPRYHFGKVTWEGAKDYPERFLQRYLAFKPGEPFSYSKTGQTQLNLINSDRFSTALVRGEVEEAKDLQVPVKITLKPSSAKQLRPGVGYGTDTGARFSLNYKDKNVFHRGHLFITDLSIAERRQAITTSYNLPSYKDLNSYTSFKLGYQQESLKAYDDHLLTSEAERVYSFGRGRIGSAYLQYRWEKYTLTDQSPSYSQLLLPGLRFSQQRYDNIIRPRKGFRYALETRGTHEIFGSGTSFVQVLGEGNLLIPLPHRFSLFTRVQAGATYLPDPFQDLPASLRFFAGGDRSVRGYTYQSLGPKDSSGNVIGGRNLLVGSLQLERGLGKNWGVLAFYDAGNSFNSFADIQYAQGAGIGVRYYTPVGPIEVDLARQINVDHPGYQLHIIVGFAL